MIMGSAPKLLTNILVSILKSEYLYLEPNSGSILIQLIIASALGAVLIVKTYWSKIKNFFRRNTSQREDNEIYKDDNK